ncbi:MAG: condensation domain-containing protein [Thiotrichaceae bacterium]
MNAKQLDQLTADEKRALLARLLQEKTLQSNNYPLSFAKQRLRLLDQLEPDNPAYNIFSAYRLIGKLSIARLESCLNHIIQRHASLRTTFSIQNEQPVQVVHPHLTLALINHDLCNLTSAEQTIEIEKFTQAALSRPFDLKHLPLLRATLLQLSESEYIFILIIHHIVADGWSLGILFKELEKLYQTPALDLPKLSIQYADFTLWQRQYLQNDALNQQINYWKQQLAGAAPTLTLPTDYPRPAVQTFNGARLFFNFPKILLDNLKKLSQQAGTTLFMTLLAGFYLLLHRYTGQEDIVLGTPIAGRNRAETEDLIGFFVNTLALRVQLQPHNDFLQLLAKVKQVALDAYHYQDLPFEILIEQLHPERNLNFSPLFQVMFAFQNVPTQDLKLAEITATPLIIKQVAAKFDLMLFLEETNTGLSGIVEYNTDLFAEATLQRLVGHLHTLLEAVVTDPLQKISYIPIITTEEQQLFAQWNATQRDYPTLSVTQLFEQQVVKTPDAIAVHSGTKMLTYQELNQQANQLAHYLRKHGVTSEVLVGIYSERLIPKMLVGWVFLKV